MKFTTTIHAPVERVFDLIAQIDRYGEWLPPSNTFKEVREVSDRPVRAGTTYIDQGQSTPMRGHVTVYERPTRIGFAQAQNMPLGRLAVETTYTLVATASGTHVTRDFQFHTGGLLLLIRPLLAGVLRQENERILAALKGYAETP